MIFKPTLVPTFVQLAASLLVCSALPVLAQSGPLDELKEEIRKLRAEVEAMKRAQAEGAKKVDATKQWGDRIEQLEIKSKDAVVGGDIGGGFRLPGSETSLRVYGHAEAQLIHDRKGTSPGDNFTNLMEQPLNGSGYTSGKTKMTAQTSRFGFETATPTQHGTLTTKVEGDFYAYCGDECNRNRLRLRHAYGEYAGWLIGQTWSTFMDLDNLPEVVEFNGPIGSPFSRRMMIRYTYADAKAGVKYTAALEDPEDGARMPNLVARYDRSFDWGAINVRLLAHEKRVETQTKRGFGFGLGASYKLTGDDLLMGQWARVNGDYDMMYGTFGYGLDANNKLIFDKVDGAVFGWAHTFSPKLRSNLVLGLTRSKGDTSFDNRTLRQLHAGFIYVPVKNVELGAEYIHGTRKTFSGETGVMSRLDMMARYSF